MPDTVAVTFTDEDLAILDKIHHGPATAWERGRYTQLLRDIAQQAISGLPKENQ